MDETAGRRGCEPSAPAGGTTERIVVGEIKMAMTGIPRCKPDVLGQPALNHARSVPTFTFL